jgi:tetratricopeptide (TPR) repeat protein
LRTSRLWWALPALIGGAAAVWLLVSWIAPLWDRSEPVETTGKAASLPGAEGRTAEPGVLPGDTASQPKAGAAADAAASSPPDRVAAAKLTVDALEREALEVANRLLQDFPDSADAVGLLGMAHNRCGNTAKALECWEKGMRRFPKRGDFYQAAATVALRKGDYGKAVELCRTGLEEAPQTRGLHSALAQALRGLGEPAEAAAALEQEIKISSKDPESYFLLGQTYAILQEHQKAKGYFEAAVKLRPQDPRSHYGLATACAKLGLAEEAQQHLEDFRRLDAEDMQDQRSRRDVAADLATCRKTLAKTCAEAAAVYQGHRNTARAEELLRKAISLDSRSGAARIQLALLFVATGRESQAIDMCRELIDLEPDRADHYLHLGMIYARLKQWDAARLNARRALELAPDDQQCRQFYEQLPGGK